jgi:hypothetical protein
MHAPLIYNYPPTISSSSALSSYFCPFPGLAMIVPRILTAAYERKKKKKEHIIAKKRKKCIRKKNDIYYIYIYSRK